MNIFLHGDKTAEDRFSGVIPGELQEYLLAHSHRYFMALPHGYMLLQEMKGIDYYLRYDLISAGEDFELSFHVPDPVLALVYMVEGSVSFRTPGNKLETLEEGAYYISRLPAAHVQTAVFTKGDYQLLLLDVAGAMAGHYSEYTILGSISGNTTSPTEAIFRKIGNVDYQVIKAIDILTRNREKKWETELIIQSIVSSLIRLFVKQLDQDESAIQTRYYEKRLEAIKSYIQDNLSGDLSIARLSRLYRGSAADLNKQFRALYKCSLRDFIHAHKMEQAMLLLQDRKLTVNEIADLTGYNNANNFTRAFTSYYKMTPTQARRARK